MRPSKEYIEKCRVRGRASQQAQANNRLAHAVDCRSIGSCPVFEIGTHNPRTSVYHFLEIRHEMQNGNNRYSVYLDGDRWHKQFSRWGFCRWLFSKIDPVLADWE